MTRILGFKPPYWRGYFFYKSFICINRVKKNDIMDCSFTYLAFFLSCNHANGRVDYEDSWVIKCRFTTKDAHEACQLKRTKVQPIKTADVFLSLSLSLSQNTTHAHKHTHKHTHKNTHKHTHKHTYIWWSENQAKRQQKLFWTLTTYTGWI